MKSNGVKKSHFEATILAPKSAEVNFLVSLPWILDAFDQGEESMRTALANEADRLTTLPLKTRFTLVADIRDLACAKDLIYGLRLQSYQNWQLHAYNLAGNTVKKFIESLKDERISVHDLSLPANNLLGQLDLSQAGDLVVYIGPGIFLHPQLLGIYARHRHAAPDDNFYFCNEATVAKGGRFSGQRLSKPQLDVSTLLRANYVGSHYVVANAHLEKVTTPEERRTASSYEVVLKLAAENSTRAHLFPYFGSYQRHSSEALTLETTDWTESYARGAKFAKPGPRGHFASLSYQAPKGKRLLVAIPFRDQEDMTIECLEALAKQTTDMQVEVALVSNNSRDDAFEKVRAFVSAFESTLKINLLKLDEAFNYARLNNFAVSECAPGADFVLFLNNDVVLTESHTLERMAGQLAADKKIAFVGIRLLYPDSQDIQHGGIRTYSMLNGSGYYRLGHCGQDDEFVMDEHVVPAVTFACAMTRAEVFAELGGLEEIIFPNGFGDVDICFRALERGYTNFYLGTVSAVHFESRTRAPRAEDYEYAELSRRHLATIANQRLCFLGLNQHREVAVMAASALLTKDPLALIRAGGALPVRYRIVDSINDKVKFVLGPVHGLAKRLLGGHV